MSYFEEGLKLFKEGEYKKAIELFNKALNKEENTKSEIYNYLGLSENALGNLEEAVNYYDKAIETDENYAELYYNRANTKCNLGLYEEAVKDYDKVIELVPTHSKAMMTEVLLKVI